MSSENIQIVATAQDRASATLRTLKGNVASMGTASKGPLGGMLSGFAGINPLAMAAGVGVGILAKNLLDGVAGALAEEKQMARLGQVLHNTVKDWDGSTAAIDRATESSMDLAFADDETRESIIKLMPATKDIGKSIDRMGLAMDIARGRGIDLATATDIVNKASMGNTGALRRMGIAIEKGASPMKILTTLMETYGGQAEKYANTTSGKLEAQQIKVNEAFEDFGHVVIGSVAGAMEGWEDFFSWYDNEVAKRNGTNKGQNKADFVPDESGARHLSTIFSRLNWAGTGAEGARVYGTAFNDNIKKIKFGEFLTDDLAGALKQGVHSDIDAAMKAVTWAIKHPLALTRQTAEIEGALTTLNYKRGLASNTPEVNAVIDQQISNLEDLWSSLTSVAYQKGLNAANALEKGLRTFTPVNIARPYTGTGKVFNGGRASGGPVNAGGTYLVGERGPEVLHMGNNSGRIQANHNMGNGPIHVVSVNELRRLLDEGQGRQLALSPSSSYSRG